MATRSFLLDSQIELGLKLLIPDDVVFPQNAAVLRREFSLWLEQQLLGRLQALGDFGALKPVLLGSWSRHELAPKSDVDLLFVGDESEVKDFVAKAMRAGIRLRSRTPEDPKDWTVGVEPFDVLALHFAVGFTDISQLELQAHNKLSGSQRRAILSAIQNERKDRRQRQDSITNYLEPNLKFGVGGLRDIEQALAVRELYKDDFAATNPYPFKVLHAIKEELLYLRSVLHMLGSSDILSAHDQLEVAQRLKMESAQSLMKFVQGELERASFYADWVVEYALKSKRNRSLCPLPPDSFQAAVQGLMKNPGLELQFQIRLAVDQLVKPLSSPERGRALHKALFTETSDAYLVALYRSRVLEVLIPDLKRLKGLVQHDHYHRFTADAHLVQTLREVERSKVHKRTLNVLSKLTTDLTAQEWWTLKLTALFHDLAKGRKGDHSTEGGKLVEKYFAEWGFSDALRDDVRWLVENHLILSTAAFRQNPQSQTTWKRLFDRGAQGRRLILLALFTAIDIRATNPEAWTPWKAQLMLNLVENMVSPEARSLHQHLKYLNQTHAKDIEDWLLQLDPALLQSLSPRILIEDLRAASEAKQDLGQKVIKVNDRIWVRFHRREDTTGTFLSFVRSLYGFGLNIQMSSVATLPGIGVYDWFCLRTEKSARQVSQWLNLKSLNSAPALAKVPVVQFQSIDVMAQDQDEWIFSFRGRDQRGLLLAAATALKEENLSLRWAKAHTWGQQIDDIFSVQPLGEVEETLNRLRKKFVT